MQQQVWRDLFNRRLCKLKSNAINYLNPAHESGDAWVRIASSVQSRGGRPLILECASCRDCTLEAMRARGITWTSWPKFYREVHHYMSYLFFLSYAREDNKLDGLVRKFYEDLCKDIAGKIAASPDEVGFFDGEEIEPGAIWDQKLASALQQSCVFIAVYSPFYFQKKFCGKEWAVFSSRVNAYAKSLPQGADFPGLMFPVLWQKEDYVLPRIPAPLGKVQYKYDAYGKAYAEQGLRTMLRNKKFKQQYDDFISVLADDLIEAAQEHKLPALPNLPPLDQVAETFPAQAAVPAPVHAQGPPQVAGANPRYVKFIFLAGRRQELQPFRASLDPYGESGGEWRPWLPDPRDEVDLLVQDVIQRERLISDGAIPLDNELG